MSQPPAITRFSLEDYPDAPEWFGNFLESLNISFPQVANGLGELTRGDNLIGFTYVGVRVQTYAALAADAKPFPIFLPIRQATVPRVLLVGKVELLTQGGTLPTTAVQPLWDVDADGKRLRIRWLSGLAVNQTYQLNFVSE